MMYLFIYFHLFLFYFSFFFFQLSKPKGSISFEEFVSVKSDTYDPKKSHYSFFIETKSRRYNFRAENKDLVNIILA